MTAREWYAGLLRRLRESYGRAYVTGVKLEPDLKPLYHNMLDAAGFQDLMVSSSLRRRATGEKVDTSSGFTLQEIVKRNPWFADHRVQMSPIITERVKTALQAEKDHIERVRLARNKPNINQAVTHAEMLYRHVTAEVANVSEQVALAVPEIGSMFTYGEYLTRDDRRVRPTHCAMYGFVARRSENIWVIIRPPCGFNCRCFVRWYTKREAESKRWVFDIRWPNTASKRNFEQRLFPDEGWRGPKLIAD